MSSNEEPKSSVGRDERLKVALRANLKKRKRQARQRAGDKVEKIDISDTAE